ncbi:hypothetical protein HK097_000349, partial [Rhizophlyctis rosea]
MSAVAFPLELVVDRYYLKDVLRAVLHSIIFHRSFEVIRPREVDIEQLGVTYVCSEDAEVENTIEDKVAALVRTVDAPGASNKVQLAVMFFERRPKKAKSWFAKSEPEVCWE